MTDLILRLRALADDCMEPTSNPYRPSPCDTHVDWYDSVRPLQQALREAADALEWAKVIEESRDNLKAKLAECEESSTARQRVRLCERLHKAEAEAAALREALEWYSVPRSGFGLNQRAAAALSQPGPGAAYQERVRGLEAVAKAGEDLRKEIPGLDLALPCVDKVWPKFVKTLAEYDRVRGGGK